MHTIDANSELGALNLSLAQAITVSAAGTAVDVSGFQGILKVNFNCAKSTGGVAPTMDANIQTGDLVGGGDAEDIPGASFAQVTDALDSFQSIGVDTRLCKKYIRVNFATAGGGAQSFVCSVDAVGQQKYQ
jgi:hypothetical protein